MLNCDVAACRRLSDTAAVRGNRLVRAIAVGNAAKDSRHGDAAERLADSIGSDWMRKEGITVWLESV